MIVLLKLIVILYRKEAALRQREVCIGSIVALILSFILPKFSLGVVLESIFFFSYIKYESEKKRGQINGPLDRS